MSTGPHATAQCIALEDQHGATNYQSLPVVLDRGQGACALHTVQ